MRFPSALHLFSPRLAFTLCFSLYAATLSACAKEHSIEELIARAGERTGSDSDGDPIDVEPPPFMGPFDAGPQVPVGPLFDAGRRPPVPPPPFDASFDAGFDSGLQDAGSRRDGSVRDAGANTDANLPRWESSDAAILDASVVATCPAIPIVDAGTDAAPATDAGPVGDGGCRAAGWHTPPCYRAPIDCPAVHESVYCTGFGNEGELIMVGMDRGTSCRVAQDPKYPIGPGSKSFARIGPDLFTIDGDVILKRSITDGSFDVAPVQAWTVFGIGDGLGIVATDGTIQRYANWQALKSGMAGEILAQASAGANPAFGGNRTTVAAAWPDGSLYLLTAGEARQRTLRLQGYDRGEAGSIRGLDLSDSGRIYVATDLGISIYNAEDGRAVARLRTPQLNGLVCEPGLAAGTEPPVLAASPRPGYYAPANTEYVISASDCRGPFNGPRYVGERAGPELFVIGNFFTDPNTVRDERSTPHALVLTSIEPTQWTVTVSANAKLERILLNGSTSTLVLQSPTSIPVESFFDTRSLGQHDGHWPSLEESRFRAAVEQQAGRAVTEAFGCHFGSNYVLRDLPPQCGP